MRTLLVSLPAAALVLALAACGSSSSPQPASQPATPTTPATPPTTQQSPSPATPAADTAAPGIGQKCGANDLCAEGLECVSYYGIAGARGPQFKSCEHRCGADKLCPSGTVCKTIADGPGQVCR